MVVELHGNPDPQSKEPLPLVLVEVEVVMSDPPRTISCTKKTDQGTTGGKIAELEETLKSKWWFCSWYNGMSIRYLRVQELYHKLKLVCSNC